MKSFPASHLSWSREKSHVLFLLFSLVCVLPIYSTIPEIDRADAIYPRQVILSDLIFLGSPIGEEAHLQITQRGNGGTYAEYLSPVFHIDRVLFGNILTNHVSPAVFEGYLEEGNSFTLTNGHFIVFAVTNNWWETPSTNWGFPVHTPHQRHLPPWGMVTGAITSTVYFTEWTLRYGNLSSIQIPDAVLDEHLQYMSNLIHIARIVKDEQEFTRTLAEPITNKPWLTPRMRKDLKLYQIQYE